MEFSPDCALFVCNKWDNIPASEASEVIKHITDKLRQCLPALDPDLQVMRLSTAKALMVQKYNIMNAEFFLTYREHRMFGEEEYRKSPCATVEVRFIW